MPTPWLVNRRFDLAFIANVYWPLAALAFFAASYRPVLDYYGVFLLAIPHRALTLALVFLDPERAGTRPFVAVGITVAAFYAALFALGGTALVLVVKFTWDVWHGASQHYGVLRLYERGRPPDPLFKALFLGFVLYAYFRAASLAGFASHLALAVPPPAVDLAVLCVPLLLWLRGARSAYFVSVMLSAGALLLAAHTGHTGWVLALAFASGLFHATEYLAVVSYTETRKPLADRDDFWAFLVQRWVLSLGVFVGGLSLLGWVLSTQYASAWLVVVTFVSFLHYAYDGMIWKRPRVTASARTAPCSGLSSAAPARPGIP